MAISMQDVMSATAPMVDAFNVNEGRRLGADRAESQANINFDKRVQAEALPITRMLNTDGTLDKNAIKGAGKGFTDPYDMWEALNEQMPGNRAIDPVVFQEKYQMGKQLYDMNLMNQIGQMGDSGMSQKKIRNALKENPDLYDYALNNNIIPRKKTAGVTFGDVTRTAGMVGAGVGAERLFRAYGPQGMPDLSKMRELRQAGFKVVDKNGRMTIKKMTDMELANRDKLSMWDELKQPKAKRSNVIRKNKTLDKALQGGRGATNKILSKGLNPKASWLTRALKGAGKFKGGGLAGAGVGIGASLLAEYLMSQED
tara:strand:+ start:987 stop:1925 length:939 start_codon:yes stop_codon:yes gene_type:complete